MKILKMRLKQSFSYSKRVLSAILSLTILSNCVLVVQSLTIFFFLTVPNFAVFFRLSNRKFNEDSKNVLKTVIF